MTKFIENRFRQWKHLDNQKVWGSSFCFYICIFFILLCLLLSNRILVLSLYHKMVQTVAPSLLLRVQIIGIGLCTRMVWIKIHWYLKTISACSTPLANLDQEQFSRFFLTGKRSVFHFSFPSFEIRLFVLNFLTKDSSQEQIHLVALASRAEQNIFS